MMQKVLLLQVEMTQHNSVEQKVRDSFIHLCIHLFLLIISSHEDTAENELLIMLVNVYWSEFVPISCQKLLRLRSVERVSLPAALESV